MKKRRKRLGLRVAERWLATLALSRHEIIYIPKTDLVALCRAVQKAAR